MVKLKYKRHYLTPGGYDKLAKRGGWCEPAVSDMRDRLFPKGKARIHITRALLMLIAELDYALDMERRLPAPVGPRNLYSWVLDRYGDQFGGDYAIDHPVTYARRMLPHVLQALERLKP